jgi:uncharacterized membrane protein SirB2
VREFGGWLQSTPLSIAIQSHTWITPLLQAIHILMIGVVFVSMLMIALRVLGRVRMDESLAAVWGRFAPWLRVGLAVMTATGVILIIGEPVREFTSTSFWLKMALLATAVTSGVWFGRTVEPAAAADAPAAEPSGNLKAAVIVTIAIWVAIIFLGRAIAYDLEVWGSLSLHA